MDNFLLFLVMCGILLYAYDLFFLRKSSENIKSVKKNKKKRIDNEDQNSLEDVLTILDK